MAQHPRRQSSHLPLTRHQIIKRVMNSRESRCIGYKRVRVNEPRKWNSNRGSTVPGNATVFLPCWNFLHVDRDTEIQASLKQMDDVLLPLLLLLATVVPRITVIPWKKLGTGIPRTRSVPAHSVCKLTREKCKKLIFVLYEQRIHERLVRFKTSRSI
jgi:hypothetical protein